MKTQHVYLLVGAGCLVGYYVMRTKSRENAKKFVEEQTWWDWLWTPIGKSMQMNKEAV